MLYDTHEKLLKRVPTTRALMMSHPDSWHVLVDPGLYVAVSKTFWTACQQHVSTCVLH